MQFNVVNSTDFVVNDLVWETNWKLFFFIETRLTDGMTWLAVGEGILHCNEPCNHNKLIVFSFIN